MIIWWGAVCFGLLMWTSNSVCVFCAFIRLQSSSGSNKNMLKIKLFPCKNKVIWLFKWCVVSYFILN
jgi:hypothetical protein